MRTFLIPATLGTLLSMALAVQAQKPQARHPFELPPPPEAPSTTTSLGRFDDRSGHPIALYHLLDATQGDSPEARARHWLSNNAARLGLADPSLADLHLKHVRSSAAGHNVRFTQTHLGLPVFGTEIVVNLDLEGRVRNLHSSYAHDLPETLPPAIINAAQAREALITAISLQAPYQFDDTRQVVYAHDGIAQHAFAVNMVGHEPIGDWEALLDASSGQFITLHDRSCYHHEHKAALQGETSAPLPAPAPTPEDPCAPPPPGPNATGSGFVYDADPLSQAGVAYGTTYVDGSDATTANLDAARVTRTLSDITLTGSTYSLEGPYAAIREFENPNKGLFAQTSSTFNFNRNADAFEGVNTYYFIDMSMRYLNLTLGVSVMPYQYTTGVQFDAHGLNGADNSHFVGSTGRLAFGEGGVDDAEDSDVILHELGHGLHNWITVGGLSNVQGLSEGTGDYWTQSHSRSLAQWTTAQPAYHWVFNWDGHNPFWGGRTTNYGAVYPGGLTGAIHTDGQIWSTCLMRIYDAIGRAPTDRALWEGLAMTGGTTNQQDAAIAVRQAAINMGYTSTQINTISTLLTSCGYVLPPILPVRLSAFNAERSSPGEVKLDWITAVEAGATTFSIERRLEHETEFATVGSLEATGQSGSYGHLDPNAYSGMSFYRLRYQDLDGNATHSEVVEVAGITGAGFSAIVWPTPSDASLHIRLEGATSAQAAITVTDLRGMQVLARSFSTDTAADLELPEAAQLPAGVYQVQVATESQKQVLRWVKR